MNFMRQQRLFPEENSNLPQTLLLPMKNHPGPQMSKSKAISQVPDGGDAWKQKDSLQARRPQAACIPSGLGNQDNLPKDLFSEHSYSHIETYSQDICLERKPKIFFARNSPRPIIDPGKKWEGPKIKPSVIQPQYALNTPEDYPLKLPTHLHGAQSQPPHRERSDGYKVHPEDVSLSSRQSPIERHSGFSNASLLQMVL